MTPPPHTKPKRESVSVKYIPEQLYVNVLSLDPKDEYDQPPSMLVLSPHQDDSCDAVCFGYQHQGSIPDDEEEAFNKLADRFNAVDDLAMLVRRLCSKLPDDQKVKQQALDYLKRKGFEGSVLR